MCFHADEGGNNIILQKLILSVADRPDLELDLKGMIYNGIVLVYSVNSMHHTSIMKDNLATNL